MMRNSKTVETGRKRIHGNIINRAEGLVECQNKEERLFWDHTQLLSGSTASFSGGGKNLVAEEIRAGGVLLKDGRSRAPLHEAYLSILFCSKSLPVNENVAFSTGIQQMLEFFSSRKVPCYHSPA